MIHHRQRLPLGLEPSHHLLGVHAEFDDLQRDAAADRFVLLGHPHHTEAALADLLQESVAPNAVSGLLGQRALSRVLGFPQHFDGPGRGRFEKRAGAFGGRQQTLQFLPKGQIAGTSTIKIRRARTGIAQRQGGGKDLVG